MTKNALRGFILGSLFLTSPVLIAADEPIDGMSLGSEDTDEECERPVRKRKRTLSGDAELYEHMRKTATRRKASERGILGVLKRGGAWAAMEYVNSRAQEEVDYEDLDCSIAREPKAEKPTATVIARLHGKYVIDPYKWMEDRSFIESAQAPGPNRKRILSFVKAENAYTTQQVSLRESERVDKEIERAATSLLEEFPFTYGEYEYYTRKPDKDSPRLHCRKKIGREEEVYLNEAHLARDHEYFQLGGFNVDAHERLVAYSFDTRGNEVYRINFKDTVSGETLEDELDNAGSTLFFDKAGRGLFYFDVDGKGNNKRLMWHRIGASQEEDTCIYNENNERLTLGMDIAADTNHLVVTSVDHRSLKVFLVGLTAPAGTWQVLEVCPYGELSDAKVDVLDDVVYTVGRRIGNSFQELRVASLEDISNKRRQISFLDDEYVTDFRVYDRGLVVLIQRESRKQIRIFDKTTFFPLKTVRFKEPVYDIELEYATREDEFVRYRYSSPRLPSATIESEFSSSLEYKRAEGRLPEAFDSEDFKTALIFVEGEEGIRIPVSLLYKEGNLSKESPLLVKAYGSYGESCLMGYSEENTVLTERGFVIANVHARGGSELGIRWHDAAIGVKKRNTLIDVALAIRGLHERDISNPEKTAFEGGSVGGLVAGFLANEYPSLTKLVILENPFLDLLGSMVGGRERLSLGEEQEFGNPRDSVEMFEAQAAISPLQNVKKQEYPHMLFLTSMGDSRVPYWEALKMCHKVRKDRTNDGLTMFFASLSGGHIGESEDVELSSSTLKLAMLFKLIG
jgi:oligopeptidase B